MVKIVDVFAGTGGMAEGFCGLTDPVTGEPAFRVVVSAEMDAAAHSTLLLRNFFRQFGSAAEEVPDTYYEYLAGRTEHPYDANSKREWLQACRETLQVELGTDEGNRRLYTSIEEQTQGEDPWILIGGPPCQAYSLIGRSRNSGIKGYKPEDDARHFLYREYLKIVDRFKPDAFVMENVPGILTSAVSGEKIFGKILGDLEDPGKSLRGISDATYEIVPVVLQADTAEVGTHRRFIVQGENHGIPQTRRRVVLLGIKRGAGLALPRPMVRIEQSSVAMALAGLPMLRSGLNEVQDTPTGWSVQMRKSRKKVLKALGRSREFESTRRTLSDIEFRDDLHRGANVIERRQVPFHGMPQRLHEWFHDPRLDCVLNHETRSHMGTDLARYLFCSAFAQSNDGQSPTSRNFPEPLHPDHANWSDGSFADRFRVQSANRPGKTITSHIAKDGHYYIHHDPSQCRSMTAREAARIQTFPDNYFFMGSRTDQFRQVGNAVPPLLARQIAVVVQSLFDHNAPVAAHNTGDANERLLRAA